jgi:type IV secretory pathway TraG/TraD family ATPase VirD4
MEQHWGRNETVVWPPHQPLYSYAALAAALVLTLFFGWQHQHFSFTPLQRLYLSAYIRTDVMGAFGAHGKHRLLYTSGPHVASVPVVDLAVVPGSVQIGEGKTLPVELSPAAKDAGMTLLYLAPEQKYADAPLHSWLKSAIYAGKDLADLYMVPLFEGFGCLVIFLGLAVPADARRYRQMKYGRLLKGPLMLSPQEFNQAVQGDGIEIRTSKKKHPVAIPLSKEAQHIEIMGDTGTGKTTLITQLLMQIQQRGETAIINDPACEFVSRFYDETRGDVILNPLDERCPYWGPVDELRSEGEAEAIADSLYQPEGEQVRDKFFYETPAQIFARMIVDDTQPTPTQLVEWMCNEELLEQLVAGTELAQFINRSAGPQRTGVLSSLGMKAKSFRLLPTLEQAQGRTWSANEWSKERRGWIFLTSQPGKRSALRPLHSLWIDLLVMRLLTAPTPGQRPAWFVIDELASLQRLPQLHTAITENRKSGNPIVLGFQGKAQLETLYGHLAEVMLSQPATKIFLRTTEPKAAEWVSKALGSIEVEKVKETKFSGSRHGKNFTLERVTEPLVMDSEITGLADRHAFLKLGNNVARFSFPYLEVPESVKGFIPRAGELVQFRRSRVAPQPPPANPAVELPRDDEEPPYHASAAAL